MAVERAVQRAISARPFNALITETFETASLHETDAINRGLKPFTFVAKDCFAYKDVPVTCASKMLSNFVAPYTATILQRLIEHGGSLLGKANMDEFAMGSTSTHSFYGPVKSSITTSNLDNDWRIAGGSSGGCAVAVHRGFADVALGTDTGGSTRNPAAFHGIVGFKPSYGTLSRYGHIPLANSFDVPAIFANTVDDCERYYGIMAGVDPCDSTSIDPLPRPENIDPKKLTIGIPRQYVHPMLSENTLKTWNDAAELLESAGCTVKHVDLPHTEYSIICYHILAETDIASNMARFDGVSLGYRASENASSFNELLATSRSASLNDTVRRRIFVGNYYNVRENRGKYFQQAAKVRRLIKQDFDAAFAQVDILLTPVTSHSAPLFSEVRAAKFKSRQRQDDYFTQPANMAGLPAISVPMGTCSAGFPLGLQLIGNYLEDYRLLAIANLLHKLRANNA